MLSGKERKDYGEAPTSQADTPELPVDFFGTTNGVKARVGRQTKGYGPNAHAAANPILCREGCRDALTNGGTLLQAQLPAAHIVAGTGHYRHDNRDYRVCPVERLPADCTCLGGLLAGG